MTHQALVDTLWDTSIKKILTERFPNATEEELKVAHGYTYGGCIIQDLGYYPFGSRFFSDLLHYVRSADLLPALLDEGVWPAREPSSLPSPRTRSVSSVAVRVFWPLERLCWRRPASRASWPCDGLFCALRWSWSPSWRNA